MERLLIHSKPSIDFHVNEGEWKKAAENNTNIFDKINKNVVRIPTVRNKEYDNIQFTFEETTDTALIYDETIIKEFILRYSVPVSSCFV